jgi:hypothetical protein
MTLVPIPVTDEQAKAVQKVADFGTTVVEESGQLAGYVGRVLGTFPEDAIWASARRSAPHNPDSDRAQIQRLDHKAPSRSRCHARACEPVFGNTATSRSL